MKTSNETSIPDIIYVFSKKYIKERMRNAITEKFEGSDSVNFNTSKLKDSDWQFEGINYKFDFQYGKVKVIVVVDYNTKSTISNVFPMFGADSI